MAKLWTHPQRNQNRLFKHKGNKTQRDFNKLLELMDCLTTMLNNSDISEVSQLVTNILSKLKYRNKLVKIVDMSPVDWNIVQVYEVDSIASNSDKE